MTPIRLCPGVVCSAVRPGGGPFVYSVRRGRYGSLGIGDAGSRNERDDRDVERKPR